MKRLAALCALLTLAIAATGCIGGNKFTKELEKETGAIKLVREIQRGDYDVISTADLKALMDKGTPMVIVDAMPFEASYKKEHVPGAVQFLFPIPDMNDWNAAETDGKTKEQYEALLGPDKNKLIVTYCGFVKCTRSHNAAVWAKKLGYTNVKRYPGGIFAWKGADLPAESVK